tara:strand:+ start:568 stop:1884 length:1317 start_codon:yes stop_codon:yes gene_type:complete
MTVIRPNSISGVTSITAHTQSIEFYKSDGTLSGANLDGVNINTAGILTAANFKTGTSNVHNAGIEVAGINVLGADTPIGVGATIFNSGGAIFAGTSGVVTATAFHGNGANLTGITVPGGGTGLDLNDGVKIRLGTGNDMEFHHTSGDNIINYINGNLIIKKGSNSNSNSIQFDGNGHMYIPDDDAIYFGSSADLHLSHRSSDESGVIKANNSTGFLRILAGVSNSGGILLKNKDDDVTYLRARNEQEVELYYANNKKFETTNTGTKVTGNLQFASAGQGIDFSASTHASGKQSELLDDYERGSWTPQFFNARTGGTQLTNPSNTQANYVKVGRIVYLHLGVHGLTKNWAGSNTQIFIRGLPYRSYFQHNGHCIRCGYFGPTGVTYSTFANLRQYDTYMELQKSGGAQGRYDALYWSDIHWEGYGNITCEMVYETDQGV